MKKTIISSVVAYVVVAGIGLSVAAASLNIATLTAEYTSSSEINFAGTVDTGVLAVTCSLIDDEGEESAINSVSVSNDKTFAGSFTVEKDGKYSAVKCANYDGGAYKTVNLKATEKPGEDDKEESTDTDSSQEVVIPKAPDTGVVR